MSLRKMQSRVVQSIDSCWLAAGRFEEGTWGKDFWSQNAMYLLRKMNSKINEEK